jgi:hypothetical protein
LVFLNGEPVDERITVDELLDVAEEFGFGLMRTRTGGRSAIREVFAST